MPKPRRPGKIAGHPAERVLEFLCQEAESIERENDDRRFSRWELGLAFRDSDLDKLIKVLIANGWIEHHQKKHGPKTTNFFRLTEAGLAQAKASRHLFNWPAAESRVRPRTSGSATDHVLHLHVEMARLGSKVSDLPPYQIEILRDLENGVDEEALSYMHDWWNYATETIAARRQYQIAYEPRPAPPRIEVFVRFTDKGNLVVEWQPAGLRNGIPNPGECDWREWAMRPRRHINYASRPSNELLFIHSLSFARHLFPGIYTGRHQNPDAVMIDAVLLCAATQMVKELKERLARNFEVRMVSDIYDTFEDVDNKDWGRHPTPVLATWTIENVARRTKRIELEMLDKFEADYRCSIETFVRTLLEADVKRATGPAPSPHTKRERVSRLLRKAGYTHITPSIVKRYCDLLERHRPDLLPQPPSASGDVVPFRRPSGNGLH